MKKKRKGQIKHNQKITTNISFIIWLFSLLNFYILIALWQEPTNLLHVKLLLAILSVGTLSFIIFLVLLIRTKGVLFSFLISLLLLTVPIMGLMAELKLISISKNNQEIVEIQNAKLPTPTSISQTPIPYSARDNTVPPEDMVQDNNDPWGVAKQIDEHTWTMKIGMDERMATPQEVFDALNAYRQRNGVGALTWSESLAKYAQTRCNDFTALGGIDGHKGFNDYLNNPDNYEVLGFNYVGENSSYGYRVLGVHLIEWVYAGDKPHNDNQLNPQWSHVGICTQGTANDLIFGNN